MLFCLTFKYEQYNLFEFKGAAKHFPLKKPPGFVSLSGRTSIYEHFKGIFSAKIGKTRSVPAKAGIHGFYLIMLNGYNKAFLVKFAHRKE